MELLTAKQAREKAAEHNQNKKLVEIITLIQEAIDKDGAFELTLETDHNICYIVLGKLDKLGYKVKNTKNYQSLKYMTEISW